MKRSCAHILLTSFLLLSIVPTAHEQLVAVAAPDPQSNCVDQVVQDIEVLDRKQLDVNQDGVQDDVIIYGHDELYALVVVNRPALNCKVILQDDLTSYQFYAGKRRPVIVKQIELVDLTGDNHPELHIGLEGTHFFRESGAFHAIYMLQGEELKRIFVSDQCLPTSTFEFRNASDGARLIYLDEDLRCDPPSSSRDYAIYRWSAENSRFEQIESGQVAKESPDTFWQSALSVLLEIAVMLIAGILFAGLVIFFVLKRDALK